MNILELRNDLIESYEQLKGGKMSLRDAKERANLAGKIMGSAKLQLEYNVYAKRQTKIKFLEATEDGNGE
jgi:hypothetical protein